MERLSSCKHQKRRLRFFEDQEPKLTKIEVDLSALQLVPAEELVQFVPMTTVSDGSRCFRSISTLVSGDESLNGELKLRTVVKMSLNEVDEDFLDPISAQEKVFPVQMSEQPGTFKCTHARCKTCPFICNVEKLSGPGGRGQLCLPSHAIVRPMILAITTSQVNRSVRFQWPLKCGTRKVFHPMIAQRI